MKASDIPDAVVLNFLADHQGTWTMMFHNYPARGLCFTGFDHDTNTKFEETQLLNHVPYKVALAKMRALERRGFIGGCTCGCQGTDRKRLEIKETVQSGET